ncbi:tetratricopeptide repeat protein [Umezawaea endophytica]|uniref:Tetratricopeptide repeat protein n=1 Tax=Umezawaea endophytica TaxID=1654476 RepID=A0A9X2VME6_9PSEU|nr:tetratricopeptide repeat protein [Umezawaea endophytica]MCS7479210.1 tetratricopeptide repeat protein [Umezawaea endophytica]
MLDDDSSHDGVNLVHGDVHGILVQAKSIAGGLHFHDHGVVTVPRQLPHDIDGFTGRGADVERLCSFIEQALTGESRAIVISTVTGQGGIGKTALAIHVAHLVQDRFPDGQLYVNLRGVDHADQVRAPEDVLGEFLRALHVDGQSIPLGLDERAALYRTRIAGKRMIILLDNAANEAQVLPLLPGAPHAVAVVTSRSSLAALESTRKIPLDFMSESEGVDLLGQLVGAERVAAELPEARSLVELCGGLPLALRICGARLAAKPRWPLRRLGDLLRDETRRLGALAVGDLDVRACFSLSYRNSIGDREQRAFRLLGLIGADDFADWVVAPLLAISPDESEATVDLLDAAHLLEVVAESTDGRFRYRFHDLVRAYARDVSAAEDTFEDQACAVERLIRDYVELTANALEAYEPTDATEVVRHHVGASADTHALQAVRSDPAKWFAEEVLNLVDAVELAARFELWEQTWRLCEVLIPLLEISSLWAEWERVVEPGLAAARCAGNGRAEAIMLRRRGDLRMYTGRRQAAKADLLESVEIFRQEGEFGLCAATLLRLGEAHRFLGDRTGALRHMVEAKGLYVDLGDELGEAYALSTIGGVYRTQARWDAAVTAFLEALPVLRAHGHRRQTAITLVSLGDVYHLKSRWADAMECFGECGEIFRELGDTMWDANTARHIGIVHSICGRRELALERFQVATAVFEHIGDVRKFALTLWNIGELHADEGHLDQAMKAFESALRMFTELRDRFCVALVVDAIAWGQARHGDLDEAKTWIDRSAAGAEELRQQVFLATARMSLAQYHLRRGSHADASRTAQVGLEAFQELGSPRWEAVALDILAQACQGSGDLVGARSLWHAAARIFQEIDMPQASMVERRLLEAERSQ